MIFYFSGTGNTRWAAERIAEAIGETPTDIAAELRQSSQSGGKATDRNRPASPTPLHYRLGEGERLGFCFPTHGWQPPAIVRRFIRLATFETRPDTYTWALTTCGDNMGEAMTILNEELQAKGLLAVTLFSLIMPESYVCLPFMYTDTEERAKQKIADAAEQLEHVCQVLTARQAGVVELERGAIPRVYSYVLGAYFNRHMVSDRKFTVDADACLRCGLCSKVCPTGDIEGIPPRWLHTGQCTSCLACYHHCPTHAINYGSITRHRGQYYFKVF